MAPYAVEVANGYPGKRLQFPVKTPHVALDSSKHSYKWQRIDQNPHELSLI